MEGARLPGPAIGREAPAGAPTDAALSCSHPSTLPTSAHVPAATVITSQRRKQRPQVSTAAHDAPLSGADLV